MAKKQATPAYRGKGMGGAKKNPKKKRETSPRIEGGIWLKGWEKRTSRRLNEKRGELGMLGQRKKP